MARSRSFRSAGVGSGRKADLERRSRRGAGNDAPSILANIDEVVYVVGATEENPFGGLVELVSDRAREITGYAPQEFYEDPGLWRSLIHPDDLEDLRESTSRALASRKGGTREYRLRHRETGEYRWIEDRFGPRMDRSGRLTGLIGAARDVTERKRTQEELLQGRRWLEALFDNALEAMLLADDEARYVDANPAACALTGYSREELLRMTVWDVTPVTNLEVGRDLWRAFIDAGKQSGEYALRRKGGSNVEVEYRAVAHIVPGLHLSVLADVTDRKRAEEALRARDKRFQAMIESSLDAIALVDAEGTILYDSPAASRILGRAAGELIGRRFFEDLHPEDVETAARLFRELQAGPGSSIRTEVRFRHKDGSYRWLEAVATNLLAEPSVGAIVANYRDVTERKRTEEELRQLSSRLIQLRDEERRRIARELHDSAGQSLAALAMKLSAIGRAGSRWRPATRKALAESQALAEQCTREIRTLSYLLHPPLLDEIGLVSALRWLVDGFSERSGIRAALDVGPDLGRLAREAETTLFRVVQESLANVHRHSGSASAAIRLFREGGEVVLEVEDHGRGMAPDGLQADGPVTPGVGIAGMRERVRELGGRLKVDSGAAGTVVRVVLPLGGSP